MSEATSAPKRTFSAADLRECAAALTDRMKAPEYEELFYSCLAKLETPPHPNILLFTMEKLQCEALVDLGFPDGERALADLKGAVRRFPQDEALRSCVVVLCDVEEEMMRRVQARRCADLGITVMTPEQQQAMVEKQQQAMLQMQEAMESLPKERQEKMMAISEKMRNGTRPTPEEVAYIQECKQMMHAYVVTMQEMMAEAAASADGASEQKQ